MLTMTVVDEKKMILLNVTFHKFFSSLPRLFCFIALTLCPVEYFTVVITKRCLLAAGKSTHKLDKKTIEKRKVLGRVF
jgi:hypothetical protein